MRTIGLPELLARYAKGPVEREMALLAALPPAKRELVESRLRGIAEFRRDPGAATTVAKRFGISKRSLYRLAVRLEELGPVAALAPTAGGGRKRRADAAGELAEEAEKRLADLLAKRPDVGWTEMMEIVTRDLADPPTTAAIRRRAMQLRGAYVAPASARIGRSLLIDRIALGLPDDRPGQPDKAVLMADVLLDRETRLVLAASLVDRTWRSAGPLGLLLRNAAKAEWCERSAWRVAGHVRDLRWVLPDDIALADGQKVVDIGAAMDPPIQVDLVRDGKFRLGSELVRHIGDRMHVVELLQRATADRTLPSWPDSLREELATALLGSVVRIWNGEVADRTRRLIKDESLGAKTLLADLTDLLSPVLSDRDRKRIDFELSRLA